MAEVSATVTLRPARIALLVRPADTTSLRRFMRISACMWGGTFNPIIPVFRTPPVEWRPELGGESRGTAVSHGYIRFFEPDAFVVAEPSLLKMTGLDALRETPTSFHERVVSLDDLLKPDPHRDWAKLHFGQTIIDVLRHLYKTERRFNLREERPAYRVKPTRGPPLVEAMFGAYPDEPHSDYFDRWYDDVLSPTTLDLSAETWRKVFLSQADTPLRITRHDIDIPRTWHNELVVFVFDPTRNTDLIDLWNLRGEASPVLPVPIGMLPDLAKDIGEILVRNFRPLQGNPNGVMRNATVETSRSLTEDQVQGVVQSLRATLPETLGDQRSQGPLILKPWRNSVWETHDNEAMPGPERAPIVVKESRVSVEIKTDSRLASFPTLAPDFAEKYGDGDLRWVNVLRLSVFGETGIASHLPFNVLDRRAPRLDFSGDPVLIGTEGWSFGQRFTDTDQHFNLISREQAVIDVLKGYGFAATLSEPGHIAKQVLEHLRGLWGIHLLADVETMKLLNKMAGGLRTRRQQGATSEARDEAEEHFDRRSEPIKTWIDLVERRSAGAPRVALDQFTERNVIRLGIETTCPHCLMANWHNLGTADYQLICERCLKPYDFPQANLRRDNKNWAYRVVGPFSVPDYARGSYGALLALRCIAQLSHYHDPLTYSTALNLRFDDKVREVDFVGWYAEERHGGSHPPMLILGEAKSLGTGELIGKEDVDRLIEVGGKCPGAIIAVSVIRESFTQAEKSHLRRLVRWGRRLNENRGPTNRVLLLTGHELLVDYGSLEHTWGKVGGDHAKYATFQNTRSLRSIADASVGIHLGLPSFLEERRAAASRRGRELGINDLPVGSIGRMLVRVG